MKSMTVYDSMYPVLRGAFRADPFEIMESVFDNDAFFGGKDGASCRAPAVDMREEEDRYLIEAELPGLSEKDLKLELKDGILSLSTAKSEEKKDGDKARRWIRRERREFSFQRSFELPENADGEKIEASFKDGLLTIALPKKPETAPRLVPVKVA
jgi:HSP20 family protein